jgi:hypothetical protein
LKNTVIEYDLEFPTGFWSLSQSVIDEYTKFTENIATRISSRQVETLKSIVMMGLEDWKSNDTIASEIKAKLDFYTNYEAKRIARTETIRATSRGALSAYEQLWIEYYELLPAVDACPICKDKASNNPYKINDASARPPIHPNSYHKDTNVMTTKWMVNVADLKVWDECFTINKQTREIEKSKVIWLVNHFEKTLIDFRTNDFSLAVTADHTMIYQKDHDRKKW